jgi:hypothetical protein
LCTALRKTWGKVDLILFPIGNAGTLLSSSITSLATAINSSAKRPPPVAEVRKLAARLSALASFHLQGIITHRYALARDPGSSQFASQTPSPLPQFSPSPSGPTPAPLSAARPLKRAPPHSTPHSTKRLRHDVQGIG